MCGLLTSQTTTGWNPLQAGPFLDKTVSNNVSETSQMHWSSGKTSIYMDCYYEDESYLESLQLLDMWAARIRTLDLLST